MGFEEVDLEEEGMVVVERAMVAVGWEEAGLVVVGLVAVGWEEEVMEEEGLVVAG